MKRKLTKTVSKTLLIFILVATLLISSVPMASAAENKVPQRFVDEAQLISTYIDSVDSSEYPNGAMMIAQSNETLEQNNFYAVDILRQGGTKGTAKVTLSTIDLTACYNKDYKLFLSTDGSDKGIDGEERPIFYETGLPYIPVISDSETYYQKEDGSVVDSDGNAISSNESNSNDVSDNSLDSMPKSSEVELEFADGEYIKTVYIKTYQREYVADDYEFMLTLSHPDNCTLSQPVSNFTIKEGRKKEETRVRVCDAVVNPKSEQAYVYVERTGNIGGYTKFYFNTVSDTAQGGVDYEAVALELKFMPYLKYLKVPIKLLGDAADGKSFNVEISDLPDGVTAENSTSTVYLSSNADVEKSVSEEISPNATKKYTPNGITFKLDDSNHREELRGYEFIDFYRFSKGKTLGDGVDFISEYQSPNYITGYSSGSILHNYTSSGRSDNAISFAGVDSMDVVYCSEIGSTINDRSAVIISTEDDCPLKDNDAGCEWMNHHEKYDNRGVTWTMDNVSNIYTATINLDNATRYGSDKYIYLITKKYPFWGKGSAKFFGYHDEWGDDKYKKATKLILHKYKLNLHTPDTVKVLKNGKPTEEHIVETANFTDPNQPTQVYTTSAPFYRYDTSSIRLTSKETHGAVKMTSLCFFDEQNTNRKVIVNMNGSDFTLSTDLIKNNTDLFSASDIGVKPIVDYAKTNVLFKRYEDKEHGIRLEPVKDSKGNVEKIEVYVNDKLTKVLNWSESTFGSKSNYYWGDEIRFSEEKVSTENLDGYNIAFSCQSGQTEQAAQSGSVTVFKFTDVVKTKDNYFIITPILEKADVKTLLNVKNRDLGEYVGKNTSHEKVSGDTAVVDGYKVDGKDVSFDSFKPGETLALAAEGKEGYIPKWTVNGKDYYGKVFYYIVKTPVFDGSNTVTLEFEHVNDVPLPMRKYKEKENIDTTKAAVKLEVFAPKGSILHMPSSSSDDKIPAENALVYLDGITDAVGVTDSQGKVKFYKINEDGEITDEETNPFVTCNVKIRQVSYDHYYHIAFETHTGIVVYNGKTYTCEFNLESRYVKFARQNLSGREIYFYNLPFTASGRINLDYTTPSDIAPTGIEAYYAETQEKLPETITLTKEGAVKFYVNLSKDCNPEKNETYKAVWTFVDKRGNKTREKTTEIEKGSTRAEMSCLLAEYAKPGDKLYVSFISESVEGGKTVIKEHGRYDTGYSFINPNIDLEIAYMPDLAVADSKESGKTSDRKTVNDDPIIRNAAPAIGLVSPMISLFGFTPIIVDRAVGEKDEEGHDLYTMTIGVSYDRLKTRAQGEKGFSKWETMSFSQQMEAMSQTLKDFKETLSQKNVGVLGLTLDIGFSASFSFQQTYYYDISGSRKATTDIFILSGGFSFGGNFGLLLCCIPVFANVHITVTAKTFYMLQANGKSVGNDTQALNPKQLKDPKAWTKKGGIGIIFDGKVGAGVGFNGLVSVEGSLLPTLDLETGTKTGNVNVGRVLFSLTGAVTVSAVFASFTKPWDITKKVLASNETSAEEINNLIYQNEEDILKGTTVSDMSLNISSNEYTNSDLLDKALDEKVLEATTSNSDPQIINLGNGKYFIATLANDGDYSNILYYYIYDINTHKIESSDSVLSKSFEYYSNANDEKMCNTIEKDKFAMDDYVSTTDCGDEIMINWIKSGYDSTHESALDHMVSSKVATIFYNKQTGDFHDYSTIETENDSFCYGVKGAYNENTGSVLVAYNSVSAEGVDENTTIDELINIPTQLKTFSVNTRNGYKLSKPITFADDKTVSSYSIYPYGEYNAIAYVGSEKTGFTIENPVDENQRKQIEEEGYADKFGTNNTLYLQLFGEDNGELKLDKNVQFSSGDSVVANPQMITVNAKDFNNTLLFCKTDGKYGYYNLESVFALGTKEKESGKLILTDDAMTPNSITTDNDHEVVDDFVPIVDKDGNLYGVWSASSGDEKQIYIKHFYLERVDEIKEQPVLNENGDVQYNSDDSVMTKPLDEPIKIMVGYWGGKAQLTRGGVAGTDIGKFKSNFCAKATENGTILAAFNCFDYEYSNDSAKKINNYFAIEDFDPETEYSAPEDEVAFDVSERLPNPGETVDVVANIQNSGATTGRNVKVTLYENDKEYFSTNVDPWFASDIQKFNMQYTMPEDVDPASVSLSMAVSEDGVEKYRTDKISFMKDAKLLITESGATAANSISDENGSTKYITSVTVKNIGNADYEGGDYAEFVYLNLAEQFDTLTGDSDKTKPFYTCFGSEKLPPIAQGLTETVYFVSDEVPKSVFTEDGTNSANLEFVLTPESLHGWKEIKGDDEYYFFDEHSIGLFVMPEEEKVSEITAEDITAKIGEPVSVSYTAQPIEALDKADFTFSSSNEDIASVSEFGVVYPKKEGKVTITISSGDTKTEVTVNVAPPLYGDADEDKEISICDVTCLQKYLAQMEVLSTYGYAAGDVDHNGTTDIMDATIIQKYLAKIIKSF